jgi:hypothetical protein
MDSIFIFRDPMSAGIRMVAFPLPLHDENFTYVIIDPPVEPGRSNKSPHHDHSTPKARSTLTTMQTIGRGGKQIGRSHQLQATLSDRSIRMLRTQRSDCLHPYTLQSQTWQGRMRRDCSR